MDEKTNRIKNKSEERFIIGYVWIYGLIVALILLFVDGFKIVLPVSFLLGVFTNLLGFTLTIKCVDKIQANKNLNPKAEFIKCNAKKMIIYALVLAIAGYSFSKRENETIYLNIFATFAGLFSVKMMIYFKEFIIDKIFKKKDDKKINDGNEEKIVNDEKQVNDLKMIEDKRKELKRLQEELNVLEESLKKGDSDNSDN